MQSIATIYLCLTAYKFGDIQNLLFSPCMLFLKPMATLLHHNIYGTALAVHTLLFLSFPTHFINHRLYICFIINKHACMTGLANNNRSIDIIVVYMCMLISSIGIMCT